MECVTAAMDSAIEVHGEAELRLRAAPIFAAARSEMSCTAPDLRTWSVLHRSDAAAPAVPSWVPKVSAGFRTRKLYRPQVLLDPRAAEHVDRLEAYGATVRITTADLHETMIVDRRFAIMAGDPDERPRRYRVISAPRSCRASARCSRRPGVRGPSGRSTRPPSAALFAAELLDAGVQGRGGGAGARHVAADVPPAGRRADGGGRADVPVPGRPPRPRARPDLSVHTAAPGRTVTGASPARGG